MLFYVSVISHMPRAPEEKCLQTLTALHSLESEHFKHMKELHIRTERFVRIHTERFEYSKD